jgi:DNA-binding transcriptional LysR family regulator
MNISSLDIRQLKHVWELNKHRNFHRAAEALFISQPALTKSIQNLESVLGVPLFDRQSHSIEPTPFGVLVLEHARRIFVELEELSDSLTAVSQLHGGELKLACGPIMADALLLDPIIELTKQLPNLKVNVVIDDWSALPTRLRNGDIHLFIADVARLEDETDLDVKPLGRIENALVCRADHPLAKAGIVSCEGLLTYPLALPKITDRFSRWLLSNVPDKIPAERFYASVHKIQCQSTAFLRQLVLAGDYITGGPRRLFEEHIESGDLVELSLADCDVLFIEPGVVTLKDRTILPAAKTFISIVTGSCHELEQAEGMG